MKNLIDIKYWLFDLDNTLYSGQTKVFSEVDKKMSSFISKKFDVDLNEAKKQLSMFCPIAKVIRNSGTVIIENWKVIN